MKPLQIVFLGTNGVGKTSTIRRFLYGTFQEKTEETLAQSYNETVFLPNGIFQQVHILDTCGSDEFPAMRTVNIKTGDYFVVMYAVDDRKSFEQALNFCEEIKEIKDGIFQQVHILDTCGSDEFPAMRTVNIKTGDYFVVMYAVDDRKSFEQALNFCEEIKEIKVFVNLRQAESHSKFRGRVIKLSRDLVYTFSCLLEINGDSRASG
uniref:Uncharacterized protein n=1 Tax=Magallana gigas TaxID=29159 RepID=K1Q489_MAGGI